MSADRYLLLCGGVGGSRMAAGFAAALAPDELTIAVNTGDDFDHFGLRICPDVDTVVYMLAGLVDEERGWGRRDESWGAMDVSATLGAETWFSLGDRDLALHLRRTELLRSGMTLSQVVADLAPRLGTACRIAPMSDAPVRTIVRTADGDLDFQDYFVRRRASPVATDVLFRGADEAPLSPMLAAAIDDPGLRAIFIAPSNPVLSIAPMLATGGLRERIRRRNVPVVAVSPLVAGKAIKGPAAKLMAELGYEPGVAGILAYYEGLVDAMVIDEQDGFEQAESHGVKIFAADTMMTGSVVRGKLARFCLEVAKRLAKARASD